MTKKDIILLIQNDKWMMDVLKTVEALNLPDWWIGAGFVRGKVWDALHGYKKKTLVPDIDIIYFDKKDFTKIEEKSYSTEKEIEYQNALSKIMPKIKWSVTNQARMHLFHSDKPYKDSKESLSNWVETATCIGVRLNRGKLTLIAPFGIGDLVGLVLKPTPKFNKNRNIFNKRIKEKKWLEKWSKLQIL